MYYLHSSKRLVEQNQLGKKDADQTSLNFSE